MTGEAVGTEYSLKVKRYKPVDPRLGRHVRHDSRSLAYQIHPRRLDDLKSIRHTSNIGTLNQRRLGSCTGNALVKLMSYNPFWAAGQSFLSVTDTEANNSLAVDVYSEATVLDPFPGQYKPDDTGSDGGSVAKVSVNRGWASGYKHAMGFEAALTALAEVPVLFGTAWLHNMFNPDRNGLLDVSGNEDGGHEIVADELNMELELVGIQNSWTEEWGVNGRAYLTFEAFAYLLNMSADITVLMPNSVPAPEPEPVPANSADLELAEVLKGWHPYFYKPVKRAGDKWLEDKGLL